MNKIVFGNFKYDVVPSGFSVHSDVFRALIKADGIQLGEIEDVVSDAANVAHIEIKNETETETLRIVTGYSVVAKLEKIFDYVYDTSVDEETGESTESKCDVVLVELAKPGLAEQTAKNTSDIEYIAIMSDIEL